MESQSENVSFCEKFLCPFVKNTLLHPIYVFSTSRSRVRVSPTKTTVSQLEKRPIPISDRDSEYEEEQEQGMSEMYRSMDYTKRGYPTTSTPCSETRPSSSHLPKRRRLLSTDALHFGEFSHIYESPRPISTSAVTSGYVSNRSDTLDELVFPDRSGFSPDNSSVSPNKPGSPCNRSASPDRLDSPHRSTSPDRLDSPRNRPALNSPDRAVSPTFQGRGRRGRGVQGRGRRGVGQSRRGRGR